MSKLFLGLFVLIVFCGGVFALGVAPAHKSFNFEPNAAKSGSFSVTNPGGQSVNIVVAVQGELKDSVVIQQTSFAIPAGSERDIDYVFNMPDELNPGVSSAEIVILQLPEEGELGETYIGAALALLTQIDVYTSFPGKYAEGTLSVILRDDHKVDFNLLVDSKGEFDLTSVRGTLNIFNAQGEKVKSLSLGDVPVRSGEREQMFATWDSEDAARGKYRAVADVVYDGESFSVEKEFILGDRRLSLEDVRVKDFKLGEIARIDMNVRNVWSDAIENAYAELMIYNEQGELVAREKSPTEDVDIQDVAVMTIYWDSDGASVGTYPSTLVLSHSDRTESPQELEMVVFDSKIEFVGFGFVVDKGSTSKTVYILISIIVVLVLVNISWFIFFRKKFLKR